MLIFCVAAILSQAGQTGQSQPDPATVAKASHDKLAAARTVSVSMTVRAPGLKAPQLMSFIYRKPNKYAIKMPQMEAYADGQTSWIYMPRTNQYMPGPSADGAASMVLSMPGFEALGDKPLRFKTSKARSGLFRGRRAVIVPYSMGISTIDLYIDPETDLPEAALEPKTSVSFDSVVLNGPIKDELLAFKPPVGAKLMQTQAPGPSSYEAKLLKTGVVAPDFAIKTPTGGTLTLATSLKSHKGLLLNFWFYG